VTNAVKHFKWEPRGKRRIHAKPSAREVAACRPWLEAEIKVVQPRIIVCLGATAAQALLGSKFRLTEHRGELMENTGWAEFVLNTMHPSAVLRMPDHDSRALAREEDRGRGAAAGRAEKCKGEGGAWE
jgi:DNA polymerase